MRLGDEVEKRYRLTEGPVLGGRGEVWLAHDKELGQDVALKRARIEHSSESDFERLRAEARALARFRDHPHVVTLYDAVRVGEGADAECFLVMEHASGGSLVGAARMTPVQAARIGAQIAGALTALHAQGIVHCDVKPGNVLLAGDGSAKLTDLDSAHRAGGSETITPNRAVSYTPDYAAPEVVRGNPVPKSDVFSLAATVHELIVGKPPRDDELDEHDEHDELDEHYGQDEPDAYDVAGRAEGEVDDRIRGLRIRRGVVRLDSAVGPLAEALETMLRPRAQDRPDAVQAQTLLEEAAGLRRMAEKTRKPGRPVANTLSVLPDLCRRHPGRAIGAGAALLALAVIPFTPYVPGGDRDARRQADTGHSASPAADHRGAIGNPRTADPCALVKPESLVRFGETELDKDYGNFDRCDVIVTSRDSEVDIKVDLNSGPEPELAKPTRTVGSVGVVEESAESEECNRTLLPAGDKGHDVTVTAQQNGEGRAPLCEMADEAVKVASGALNDGRLPRRSPPLPKESLAQIDACTLLDGTALSVVPGIDASDPDIGFGNWDCDWYSTTSDIEAKLRYDRDQPPTDENARATRLGGHDAFVIKEGDGPETCLVLVVHRSYPDQHGERAVEMLHLVVGGPRPMDKLCGMATDLAGSAAAELPGGSR